MTDKLKALVEEWVKREMRYRSKYLSDIKEWREGSAARALSRANATAMCRRELQEAAGLVVKPD